MYFERKVSGKIRKVLLILEKLLVKTGKMLFFSRFDQFSTIINELSAVKNED